MAFDDGSFADYTTCAELTVVANSAGGKDRGGTDGSVVADGDGGGEAGGKRGRSIDNTLVLEVAETSEGHSGVITTDYSSIPDGGRVVEGNVTDNGGGGGNEGVVGMDWDFVEEGH